MKTFKQFILECELVEGKVEWDNPKRPLQSGFTPREKNRAKRISTEVENPDKIPSEKNLERYGKLKTAHDDEKGKRVPGKQRNKPNKDFITRMSTGQARRAAKTHTDIGDTNTRRRNLYQKDLKEPKESYEYPIDEGKVEWDNPKRPLQSGLTPREKNRAVRKRLGVENPNEPGYLDKQTEKKYERYGNLKAAHDTEKDKKTPKEKLHKFKSVAKGRLGGEYSAGRIRRMAGVNSGARTGRNAEQGKGSYAMISQTQGGEKRREQDKKRYGDYADLKKLKEPKD